MYKLTAYVSTCLYVVFFITEVSYGEKCKTVKNCECVLENNTVIDLTLISNDDGTPRYTFLPVKEVDDKNQTITTEFFFYNPCFPFSLNKVFPTSDDKKNCTNDFGCLFVTVENDKIDLYQQEFIPSSVKPTFTTTDLTYNYNKNSLIVNLHCDQKEEKPKAEIEKKGNEYTLNLTTKCACADGCHAPEPTPKSSGSKLSVGSILLILFFTILVIYVIGGIIWNGYCLGASGIELLPNLDFWREFPSLVTDGARFTVQCCLNKRTTYDSV